MRILIYDWESYFQYDIKQLSKEKGISFDCFYWKFIDKNNDDKFENWFSQKFDLKKYDCLFSVDYWPLLSKVAQRNGIHYVAWSYDNPLNVINIEETLGNPVNTVIFFDRVQMQNYKNKGFNTVHYMPLAVNTSRLENVKLSGEEKSYYGADVSFVGSLYESRLHDIKNIVDEYSNGYIEAVVRAQQNLYGCYLFDEVITQSFIDSINSMIKKDHPESHFVLLKEALTFAMASEVTRKERIALLTLLGRRYNVKLYSFHSSQLLQGVDCRPPVNYVSEMPKVFMASKINLNPVLRCIQSGIPLRALDVMGTGGFLLSSYQPELDEYFLNDEEMVMYESIEDATEKTNYYLQHDDIRERIAQKGKKKIAENFSMSDRLDSIMNLALNK